MDAKLWFGDCLELMKNISDKSVDMILADLPFSSNKRKITNLKWDSQINIEEMWREYKRIIKPNGVIALHAIQPFSSLLICSNLEWFKYDYIWEKSQAANFQLAKKMPLKKHEQILIFYGKPPTYNPQMWKGEAKQKRIGSKKYQDRKNETYIDTNMVNLENVLSDTYYPTTTLKFKSVPRNKSLHRTQKPVKLEEFFIKTYTNAGELVLDNTMGSGTTVEAAINLGRRAIGIEKDKEIFDIAVKRIYG